MRIVPSFDELKDLQARLGRSVEAGPVEQFAFECGEEGFAHGIVEAIADRAHGRADPGFPAAAAEGDGGVLAALVGVMDDILRVALLDGHLQGLQDELGPHMSGHCPTDDPAAPDINHDGQEQGSGPGWDIRDINGLITNDKFCIIRGKRIQLRAKPSYPLCYHPANQPLSRYPSDEISHHGGDNETSVAHMPTVQGLSGRTATLGSRVSISPAMEGQCADDTQCSLRNPGETSAGGES
jgi:hypothetical protein